MIEAYLCKGCIHDRKDSCPIVCGKTIQCGGPVKKKEEKK